MAQGPKWITAAEVEGTIIPEGGTENQVLAKDSATDFDTKWATVVGAGGVIGSIANGQIAFGSGTEIAGNSQFAFDKSGNFYSIFLSGLEIDWDNDAQQAILSGGQIILRGSSLVVGNGQHNPAASGDVRFQNNTSVKARNHADDGDLTVLRVTTGDGIIIGSDSDSIAQVAGAISIATSGDINLNPVGAVNISTVLALLPSDDAPASPTEGMIYADTDHHLYYYNGTTWKQLDN